MAKYFDAFLYFANWGTHILKLRLPEKLLSAKAAQLYAVGEHATARAANGNVILSFWSENEEGDDVLESGGGGWLAALISVRAELARGNLRALYLGWLLCLQNGELDRHDRCPPAPTGLRTLSASLSALVDFLRIDRDLVRVSAKRAATSRTVADLLRQRGSAATGGTARSRRARALRVTR